MEGRVTDKNLVDYILGYEEGRLSPQEILELFSYLIRTGKAWSLQGSIYGRPAKRLIDAGYIDKKGRILKKLEEVI